MKRPRFLLHAVRIVDGILFWPVLAVVIWGQLGGPDVGWDINDKLLHFLAYFALGAMAGAGFKGRRAVILAVLGLIVLGAVLEIAQAYVGRDSEVYDGLANAAGALLGGAAARSIVEFLRKRFPYS